METAHGTTVYTGEGTIGLGTHAPPSFAHAQDIKYLLEKNEQALQLLKLAQDSYPKKCVPPQSLRVQTLQILTWYSLVLQPTVLSLCVLSDHNYINIFVDSVQPRDALTVNHIGKEIELNSEKCNSLVKGKIRSHNVVWIDSYLYSDTHTFITTP